MDSCVADQIVFGFVAFSTDVAWKIPFSCVNLLMVSEILWDGKGFATYFTHVPIPNHLMNPFYVCLQTEA